MFDKSHEADSASVDSSAQPPLLPGLPRRGHHLPPGGGGAPRLSNHGKALRESPEEVHDPQHGADHGAAAADVPNHREPGGL